MPSYSVSVDVAAPPDQVWSLVGDLARHGEWAADDVRVEPAGDGRYRSRATAKGREFTAELTVVESRPPSRFEFTATDATGSWRHELTLAPSGGGTRVTRRMTGTLSATQALLFWAVLLPVKKPSAKRSLERLKALAERS